MQARGGDALCVGARLDHQPELFFTLRQVDQAELVARAARGDGLAATTVAADRKLGADTSLSDLFGIDLDAALPPSAAPPRAAKRAVKREPVKVAARVARKPRRASTDVDATVDAVARRVLERLFPTPRRRRTRQ